MEKLKRSPMGEDGAVMRRKVRDGVEYLTFPGLEAVEGASHLFTTRLGGVSGGVFAHMNLSFSRGDDPECVAENYRRIGAVLGCGPESMVCSDQTHTVNIRRVTRDDCGKGVTAPRDYTGVDGLITDCQGVALVTLFADCVPLYFVDPVRRAVGLAHSGWRGTAEGMGAHMVRAMREAYGCRPEELRAAIGPSICRQCYEVDSDVAERFQEVFAGTEERFAGTGEMLGKLCEAGRCGGGARVVTQGGRAGKYQLDLWLANLLILIGAGIPQEQIEVTDICTCHNPEYLFSHRASAGKRGNLGAFLMLKNS